MAIKIEGRTLLDRYEVADMFGISPRTLNWRVNNGKFIEPIRLGHRPFWKLSDIARWADSLTAD
jgi:predicted DNA-binding transcriptional regulator AlpA